MTRIVRFVTPALLTLILLPLAALPEPATGVAGVARAPWRFAR